MQKIQTCPFISVNLAPVWLHHSVKEKQNLSKCFPGACKKCTAICGDYVEAQQCSG